MDQGCWSVSPTPGSTSRTAISSTLREMCIRDRFLACYNQARITTPSLHGKVKVIILSLIHIFLRDLAEPKRATEQLRDELERLQGDHAELKSRMAKLEARLENGAPAVRGGGTSSKKKGPGRKK